MDPATPQPARDYLEQAHQSNSTPRPLTELWPEATIADAYRVQDERIRRRVEDGETAVGFTVAAASVRSRREWGTDRPCRGRLLRSMVHESHRPMPTDGLVFPRVAAGICFVLGASLRGPNVTVTDAMLAVESVVPTVDVLDSRAGEWNPSPVDAIADNARRAAVVLGGSCREPGQLNLRSAGCLLHVNGELVATGAGGVLLGSPWHTLTWLVAELHEQDLGLDSGDLVLAGSVTPEVPVSAGDTVAVDITGLGTVSVALAEQCTFSPPAKEKQS